jgi:methylenetetrahydrofolate reductase (NADPH)
MKRMMKFSFEFFPPNTALGLEKLRTVRTALQLVTPEFFSVTFGAGGATREKTLSIVQEIAAEGTAVAPHISCIGASKESIYELLTLYKGIGVKRLVALRGDLPSGMVTAGDFRYASDLIAYIREATGDWFHIEVAAYPETHPQAKSPQHDLQALLTKFRNGANSAMTQYFYNADAFFRFRDEASAIGVNMPIIPGIMPITNFSQLARFSDACGAEIPRWVRLKLQSFGDDSDAIKAFGHEVVLGMCERLKREGVTEFHFYTLNQSQACLALINNLAAKS